MGKKFAKLWSDISGSLIGILLFILIADWVYGCVASVSSEEKRAYCSLRTEISKREEIKRSLIPSCKGDSICLTNLDNQYPTKVETMLAYKDLKEYYSVTCKESTK